MARTIEPDCRQCRREGCKLFLKGERCTTKKCAMERRPVIPGQHGNSKRRVEKNKKLKEFMVFSKNNLENITKKLVKWKELLVLKCLSALKEDLIMLFIEWA